MDKYMVFSISFCRPANNAQQFVFDEIEKYRHKTITDETDLAAFNDYIHDLVQYANKNYPRCSNMSSGIGGQSDGSTQITIHAGKYEGWLASIKIIEISNNWKNK